MAVGNFRIGPVGASANGEQVFEAILTNWGNHGPTGCFNPSPDQPQFPCADKYALVYPVFPSDEQIPTVVGVQIAPRSDIDRVVLRYNINPLLRAGFTDPGENEAIVDSGGLLTSEQLISVERPWTGQMNGPIAIRAYGQQWWNDEFFANDPNVVSPFPFGPVLGEDVFQSPSLRLLFYLRGAEPAALKRAPLAVSGTVVASAAPIEPLALHKVIPIHGRRHLSMMLRGSGDVGSGADFRIGAIRNGIDGPGSLDASFLAAECTLWEGTIDEAEIMCNQWDQTQYNWLTIWARDVTTGGRITFWLNGVD